MEPTTSERSFFGCYLLCSLRIKGKTYIGFTVNPARRIRQHNGEIVSGAFRTRRGRPWEMILVVHGFSSQVQALQFEWAWQHPLQSLAVREAAGSLKTHSGVKGKLMILFSMLNLPNWKDLPLSVQFLSSKHFSLVELCDKCPRNIRILVSPMRELPCYNGMEEMDQVEDEEEFSQEIPPSNEEEQEESTVPSNPKIGDLDELKLSKSFETKKKNNVSERENKKENKGDGKLTQRRKQSSKRPNLYSELLSTPSPESDSWQHEIELCSEKRLKSEMYKIQPSPSVKDSFPTIYRDKYCKKSLQNGKSMPKPKSVILESEKENEFPFPGYFFPKKLEKSSKIPIVYLEDSPERPVAKGLNFPPTLVANKQKFVPIVDLSD